MNDQEPPKTVKEVGIHLVYLSKEVSRLSTLLEEMRSGFVKQKDFDEYKDEISEKFQEVKRRTWIQNTLSAVAGVVLTLLVTNWFNK